MQMILLRYFDPNLEAAGFSSVPVRGFPFLDLARKSDPTRSPDFRLAAPNPSDGTVEVSSACGLDCVDRAGETCATRKGARDESLIDPDEFRL